jgi:ribosomal protein L11 methyltransferase
VISSRTAPRHAYLEVSVSATEKQREFLIPTMIELGCCGFQETETELLCYFEKADSPKFRSGIRETIGKISANAAVRFKTIEEKNWNEQWERTIRPIEIGDRIAIRPSWATYENTRGRVVLQIDPKMSFGTGYHETTRLVLKLLERYANGRRAMLDVGTGTGVLAIAAVKLGIDNATAIDNDPWSIDNATENVLANGLTQSVIITNKSIQDLDASYDLIAANLTLHTIVDLLPEMARRMRPDCILLLSGLLQSDEGALALALPKHNLKAIETASENEWIAVVANRSES